MKLYREPDNLIVKNARIVTPLGNTARKGKEMQELLDIPNGMVIVEHGVITYVGKNKRRLDTGDYTVLDAKHAVLLPGFVDSHTHLVFGGYRPDEFIWRMNGDSYMSIMERGGGIANTVRATREAHQWDLVFKSEWLLNTMSQMGVTTVEGKSGYGLDCETELAQLRTMSYLNCQKGRKLEIIPTFLGAHALPTEYEGHPDDYIDFLINEMLPAIREKEFAENCDIFCEKGVFTIEQSRRLLKAAKERGFGVKIHADEINYTGGAELAAELGALSADHLLHASDAGIRAMAEQNVVATLLPLTAFTLREPYARGREMIDNGCAVALATDLNPGSCFSCSIPLTIALACLYMHMSVEEAITALTLNGAAALGHADRIGSIEVGKQADMVLLDSDTPAALAYYTGMNCVQYTIKEGRILNDFNPYQTPLRPPFIKTS
ncbi:imidazolonepropionase [Phocaeicola sp.]